MFLMFLMTKYTTKILNDRNEMTMYILFTNDHVKFGKGENAIDFWEGKFTEFTRTLFSALGADPPAIAGGSAPKTPHF